MNETTVRRAAEEAQKLVSSVKNSSYRASAFGVLFDRLLQSPVEMPTTRKASEKIHIRPSKVSGAKGGPMDRVRELVDEGYFKAGRSLKAVLGALRDRGHRYDKGIIGKVLQRLCQQHVLRRSKGREEKQTTYIYTNW